MKTTIATISTRGRPKRSPSFPCAGADHCRRSQIGGDDGRDVVEAAKITGYRREGWRHDRLVQRAEQHDQHEAEQHTDDRRSLTPTDRRPSGKHLDHRRFSNGTNRELSVLYSSS